MVLDCSVKKILVRAPNWIGDAVMCLPALGALKAKYPGSEISVLTRARAVPVFERNPAVSELIVYDDKSEHRGLKGRLRLSAELKEKGFGLAVLFQNAFDAAFISYISRIPERAGYARDLRTQLLTVKVPVTDEIKKKHQVYYYLNIIEALGGGAPKVEAPRIYLSGAEEEWAEGFLEKNGLTGARLLGISPGASYGPAKRWPEASFSELIDGFSASDGTVGIIFGGPEDRDTAKLVSEGTSTRHLNLAGSITLRQFMALLKRTGLFVTNDSGPMHIAAALGVPTVAIFGSTDPVLTGPFGGLSRVVIKKAPCNPCFDRVCRYGHYECLTAITPADVRVAAEGLLREDEARWPA